MILVLVIFQRSHTFFFFPFRLMQYQESARITTSLCFTVNRQKPNTRKPDQIAENYSKMYFTGGFSLKELDGRRW